MLGDILRGAVLFLVGGNVIEEVVLTPGLGICQGNPLSLILFSRLNSLIIYILKPFEAVVWLYSNDALLRFVCPSPFETEGPLASLREAFFKFG